MDCSLIKTIPDEVMCQIFSYLPISSLLECWKVSEHWHRLTSDILTWRRHRYNFVIDNVRCDSRKGGYFLSMALKLTCETIEKIKLSNIKADGRFFKSFSIPALHFPSLSEIEIIGTSLNNLQAKDLILKSKQLTKISLQNCQRISDYLFQSIHMEAELLEEVSDSINFLQHIDISKTSCTIDTILCLLDEEIFPNLTSINLESIKLCKNDIAELIRKRPSTARLPYPRPFIFGMPSWTDAGDEDLDDSYGPDLTDILVTYAILGAY